MIGLEEDDDAPRHEAVFRISQARRGKASISPPLRRQMRIGIYSVACRPEMIHGLIEVPLHQDEYRPRRAYHYRASRTVILRYHSSRAGSHDIPPHFRPSMFHLASAMAGMSPARDETCKKQAASGTRSMQQERFTPFPFDIYHAQVVDSAIRPSFAPGH